MSNEPQAWARLSLQYQVSDAGGPSPEAPRICESVKKQSRSDGAAGIGGGYDLSEVLPDNIHQAPKRAFSLVTKFHFDLHLKGPTQGAWVARSVKRPTLGFGSGHDLTVPEFEPRIGLC